VILRPLYQEKILPNLAYIGGGGELSYWLEIKALFDAAQIPFPMLVLRDSFSIINKPISKKWKSLQLDWKELFRAPDDLLRAILKNKSAGNLTFDKEKEDLKKLYDGIEKRILPIDKSLSGAVQSERQKALKGLEKLEAKMFKAEKRKYELESERLLAVQKALFPEHTLQERSDNFSMYYLHYGHALIEKLLEAANPLEAKFKLLIEE